MIWLLHTAPLVTALCGYVLGRYRGSKAERARAFAERMAGYDRLAEDLDRTERQAEQARQAARLYGPN